MTDQAETALARALTRLVVDTTLSRPQAEAIREQFATTYHRTTNPAPADLPPADPSPADPSPAERSSDGDVADRSSMLGEVGGYLGAAFVLAAIRTVIGPQWSDFSTPTKVGLLAGPGLVLAICAAALALATPGGWSWHPAGRRGPRRRLISVLTLAAGALFGGAVGLSAPGNGDHVYALAFLAFWAIGYLLCRGDVLHLGSAGAVVWTVLAFVDVSPGEAWHSAGTGLLLAGFGWAVLSALALLDERQLGFLVAGAMAFAGAQFLVAADLAAVGYLLLTGLAVLGLAGYLRWQQLSLLAVGTVSLAVVVPQAVIHYTSGSLGAAGALLVCGLSIVAASALSLRLRRTVTRRW